MKKQIFIDAINAIKEQYRLNEEVATHLSKAFPNVHQANLLPDNHLLTNTILTVLAETYGQGNEKSTLELIEYFCYEVNFGESYDKGNLLVNGKEIELKSPEDLYNAIKTEERKTIYICEKCGKKVEALSENRICFECIIESLPEFGTCEKCGMENTNLRNGKCYGCNALENK